MLLALEHSALITKRLSNTAMATHTFVNLSAGGVVKGEANQAESNNSTSCTQWGYPAGPCHSLPSIGLAVTNS